MNDALLAAADVLEQNDYVDRVVRDLDDLEDTIMVRLDWVTESHQENGTRIIESKNYDGHIREALDAIDALDDVHASRKMKSGLAGYTIFVEPGADRWGDF
jgi:hypothetical protein